MHWKKNNMWHNTYIFCESFLVSFSAFGALPSNPSCTVFLYQMNIFQIQTIWFFFSDLPTSPTPFLPTSSSFLWIKCKLSNLAIQSHHYQFLSHPITLRMHTLNSSPLITEQKHDKCEVSTNHSLISQLK